MACIIFVIVERTCLYSNVSVFFFCQVDLYSRIVSVNIIAATTEQAQLRPSAVLVEKNLLSHTF